MNIPLSKMFKAFFSFFFFFFSFFFFLLFYFYIFFECHGRFFSYRVRGQTIIILIKSENVRFRNIGVFVCYSENILKILHFSLPIFDRFICH